eukprot:SAG11_NODE_114_length_16040_cov_10.050875_4_plen_111_part_00
MHCVRNPHSYKSKLVFGSTRAEGPTLAAQLDALAEAHGCATGRCPHSGAAPPPPGKINSWVDFQLMCSYALPLDVRELLICIFESDSAHGFAPNRRAGRSGDAWDDGGQH